MESGIKAVTTQSSKQTSKQSNTRAQDRRRVLPSGAAMAPRNPGAAGARLGPACLKAELLSSSQLLLLLQLQLFLTAANQITHANADFLENHSQNEI